MTVANFDVDTKLEEKNSLDCKVSYAKLQGRMLTMKPYSICPSCGISGRTQKHKQKGRTVVRPSKFR